ncbi:hypothetical protein [Blautia sp. An81]|uniref:hypothetical protein n=1 Tax=Blautia sp. An81 TaxID=1965659 RepID=UPI000B395C77|nr:hypothetical protein [Blautia sp. An81]OUN32067.1 hypothetical protein B5G33_01530 [Blautia sp. An81]
MKLFDAETGYLLLDEVVESKDSFKKIMEDGIITDEEMEDQVNRVIDRLKTMEEILSDYEKTLVLDAISELAVLYEMNARREKQEGDYGNI